MIVEIDELRAPPEAVDRLGELGDGAAVKSCRGDDVAPRSHQREQRHDLGCVAGRTGNRAGPALKRRNAGLQRADRGIGQPRIDEADLLQAKEAGSMLGVAELIGGGLVDRHLPRAGRRVGRAARVHRQGIKVPAVAHGPRILAAVSRRH